MCTGVKMEGKGQPCWSALAVLVMFFACVFAQNEQLIEYKIKEELPRNSRVGNIASSLRMNGTDLQFAFLSESAPYRALFDLDPRSGELRTAGRIDRDEICAAVMTSCDLSVDVTVRGGSPGGLFQIAKVMVTVEDINDHQPQFPEDRHVLYLSETTQLDAAFALPTAQDGDVGINGIQKYTLAPELPQFELRVGDSECHLVVKQALDREQRAVYALVLTASDGAGNTDSLNVEVTVLDANDNAPRFEQAEYEVYVFENAGIGSTILQVQANDPDDGANGEVTYKFSPQSQTQYGGVLRIDSFTGEIVTQAELNYGQTSEYNLRIVAQDQGASSLAGYATITLKIRDLNDHAPQININALTAVPEHSEKGAFVAHVSVTDQDGGNNGKFTCSLDNPNFELERIYPTEYKLLSAAMFDRESLATYKIRVMCEDLGSPPQQAAQSVTVEVSDINDHAPHFPRSLYEVTVAENTAVSSSLVQINVTDADLGENARVTFSLSVPQSVLAIDPDTGVVTVHQALDHEESSVWEMQVIATDNGSPRPLSASATLRLVVTDVNDEAPMFPQTTFTFSIRENAPIGSELGELVAYDRDSSNFNVLQYSIDSAGARYFSVDPVEGTLRTLQPLDRESESVYNFRVEAEDNGGLSSSVQVQVLVQDDNDNAPVILVPDNMIQVSAAANVGDIVTHIRASDKDTSQNAQVRYSIASSSVQDIFSINPLSGALSVSKALSDHADETVALTLRVRDRGEPALSSEAAFSIFINSTAAAMAPGKSSGGGLSDTSTYIIIILLSVTAVVSVVLILTIVCLIRRRRRHKAANQKPVYNCHIEPTVTAEQGSNVKTSTPIKDVNTVDANTKYDKVKQPGSRHVHFPSDRQVSRDTKDEPRYHFKDGRSILTAGKLQAHNVLLPNTNNHNALVPDADSDRGSSDSGRGASEEECNNTSSDSLPARPRSGHIGISASPQKPQNCARHSPHGFVDLDVANLSQQLPPPPVPKRTCKVHGHMVDGSFRGPPAIQQGRQADPARARKAMHANIPEPKYCQSLDTSADGHSDGGSTTSGEYVVNLEDFHDEPMISKDVYV